MSFRSTRSTKNIWLNETPLDLYASVKVQFSSLIFAQMRFLDSLKEMRVVAWIVRPYSTEPCTQVQTLQTHPRIFDKDRRTPHLVLLNCFESFVLEARLNYCAEIASIPLNFAL